MSLEGLNAKFSPDLGKINRDLYEDLGFPRGGGCTILFDAFEVNRFPKRSVQIEGPDGDVAYINADQLIVEEPA